MGNSRAQMYTPALEKILHDRGEAGLLIPLNGCLPTTDINISKECLRLSRLNFNALMADTQLKVVIFSLTWYGNRFVNEQGEVVDNSDNLILAKSLIQLMKQVKETGRSVFLIGPINIPGYDLPSVLSRKVQFLNYSTDQLLNSLRIPRTEFDRQFKESQIFLGGHLGKEFLRPDDFLCDADYCYFGDLNGSYFADSNHLSNYGVAKMNLLFSAVFGNN
jgi:hypothetical protein